MSKTIRWGFLGTGAIAADFAQDLALVPGAELGAVASRRPSQAQAFAQTFKIPKTYASYADLVAAPDLDLIYIATPNPRHREDCLSALSAGKGVVCEKPLALNAQEAGEIIAFAQLKNLFLMEALWTRFNPLIQEVKTLLSQGKIGQPLYFQADFGYPVPYDPQSRFYAPEGGGALLDRGVYLLSLAQYFFGAPAQIQSQALFAPAGVEDQCLVNLTYGDGLQAILLATFKTYGTNGAVILGTQGQIQIEAPLYFPTHYRLTQFDLPSGPIPGFSPPGGKQKLLRQLQGNAFGAALLQRLQRASRQRQGNIRLVSHLGKGYFYEAAEATRCLQEGRTESAVMPLEDTLQVMAQMDAIRRLWQKP
ncbi:MAG: gfo/Idh/MocA family oxidoreductase [Cyanobacteria bacterium RI_101]|nr:gfo/Idh/MocA family oxidoreductase [Cyanobacteria bacterium RI_101]